MIVIPIILEVLSLGWWATTTALSVGWWATTTAASCTWWGVKTSAWLAYKTAILGKDIVNLTAHGIGSVYNWLVDHKDEIKNDASNVIDLGEDSINAMNKLIHGNQSIVENNSQGNNSMAGDIQHSEI